jgi:hypothetical protein
VSWSLLEAVLSLVDVRFSNSELYLIGTIWDEIGHAYVHIVV